MLDTPTQTPVAPPAAPTSSSSPTMANKGCDTCVRGGWPLKKEILSFAVIALVALSTILGVLLINEKRESLRLPMADKDDAPVAKAEAKSWSVPADKTSVSLVTLPKPDLKSTTSLEATLQTRRSRRTFAETPVTLEDLSQLLWSAQGVTDPATGHRTAPSAMSAYPFSVYVVVRNVDGVKPGFYQYLPATHQLGLLGLANASEQLNSSGVQEGAQKAPVVFLLAGAPAKMAAKLRTPGADPMPNVYIETGHIGQNLYLQAESLKMSMVVMGGFDAQKVGAAMNLDANEIVTYVIPVGNRAPETESPAATGSANKTESR